MSGDSTIGVRDGIEPSIKVSMVRGQIVIQPIGRLDDDGIEALLDALAGAQAAGATVVFDLAAMDRDHRSAFSMTVPCDAPNGRRASRPGSSRPLDGEIVGPGCIRLASTTSWWTVDVAGRRLSRAAARLDPRSVAAEAWVPVRTVSISPRELSAVTGDGAFICSTRA